jgi:hypothetical protein
MEEERLEEKYQKDCLTISEYCRYSELLLFEKCQRFTKKNQKEAKESGVENSFSNIHLKAMAVCVRFALNILSLMPHLAREDQGILLIKACSKQLEYLGSVHWNQWKNSHFTSYEPNEVDITGMVSKHFFWYIHYVHMLHQLVCARGYMVLFDDWIHRYMTGYRLQIRDDPERQSREDEALRLKIAQHFIHIRSHWKAYVQLRNSKLVKIFPNAPHVTLKDVEHHRRMREEIPYCSTLLLARECVKKTQVPQAIKLFQLAFAYSRFNPPPETLERKEFWGPLMFLVDEWNHMYDQQVELLRVSAASSSSSGHTPSPSSSSSSSSRDVLSQLQADEPDEMFPLLLLPSSSSSFNSKDAKKPTKVLSTIVDKKSLPDEPLPKTRSNSKATEKAMEKATPELKNMTETKQQQKKKPEKQKRKKEANVTSAIVV